jgi:hypothetical protein
MFVKTPTAPAPRDDVQGKKETVKHVLFHCAALAHLRPPELTSTDAKVRREALNSAATARFIRRAVEILEQEDSSPAPLQQDRGREQRQDETASHPSPTKPEPSPASESVGAPPIDSGREPLESQEPVPKEGPPEKKKRRTEGDHGGEAERAPSESRERTMPTGATEAGQATAHGGTAH